MAITVITVPVSVAVLKKMPGQKDVTKTKVNCLIFFGISFK